jgi:hypothetical protein
MMKHIVQLSILFFITACVNKISTSYNTGTETWENLLDKNHINKWNIKIRGEDYNYNYLNTFKLTDSMIEVSYDKYETFNQKFGHIFYSDSLSFYKLEFEYFIHGEHVKDAPAYTVYNSGVMLHAQPAASMTFNQGFPMCLEMQLLGNKGEVANNFTGNLCTPGTQVSINNTLRTDHCINSSSPKYEIGRWIKASVDVYGDSLINQKIEDQIVLSYTSPILKYESSFISNNVTNFKEGMRGVPYWIKMDKTPLKGGQIAFQAESQPIKFRNIRLLNLCGCMDKKAKNYKSYYIKPDNSTCVY